jgi:hypothetical protein
MNPVAGRASHAPSAKIASRLLLASLMGFALVGCGQHTSLAHSVQATVSSEELKAAASRRVIYAHQSIGNNILDGMRALASAGNVSLNIVKTRAPAAGGAGVFHFAVGENGFPEGKIEDFERTLAGGTAGAQVALLELCYVDFGPDTNGRTLAEHYASALQQLQARYPETRFVAMTAPLTTIQTGPRAWIKRMLGREPAGYAENARRSDFNAVIRLDFSAQGTLFDVAALESSGAGTATQFERNGQTIPALDPALSEDGGHLNDSGKAVVGAALVKFLAALPQ